MAANSTRWKSFMKGNDQYKDTIKLRRSSDVSGCRSAVRNMEDVEYKLQFTILEQKRELKRLQQSLDSTKSEVSSQKEKMTTLECKLKGQLKHGMVVADENGRELIVVAKTIYQEEARELKESQQSLSLCRRELVAAQETSTNHANDVNELKGQMKLKESQIQELEDVLEDVRKDHMNTNNLLGEEQDAHARTTKTLSHEIQQGELKLESKEREMEKMMSNHKRETCELAERHDVELCRINKECDKLTTELFESKEENHSLEEKCEEMSKSIDLKELEIVGINEEVAELERGLEESEMNLQEQAKETETYKLWYEELGETHEEVLDGHSKEDATLREEIEIRDTEIGMMKDEVNSLMIKMKKMEGKPRWK